MKSHIVLPALAVLCSMVFFTMLSGQGTITAKPVDGCTFDIVQIVEDETADDYVVPAGKVLYIEGYGANVPLGTGGVYELRINGTVVFTADYDNQTAFGAAFVAVAGDAINTEDGNGATQNAFATGRLLNN